MFWKLGTVISCCLFMEIITVAIFELILLLLLLLLFYYRAIISINSDKRKSKKHATIEDRKQINFFIFIHIN